VEIETVGQSFDPRWHRISELVQDPDRPDGTIVRQDLKGYVWRNLVLREAEVDVVRNDEGQHTARSRAAGKAS
jgi:molecular chaperone GrpE (heat shock protein)